MYESNALTSLKHTPMSEGHQHRVFSPGNAAQLQYSFTFMIFLRLSVFPWVMAGMYYGVTSFFKKNRRKPFSDTCTVFGTLSAHCFGKFEDSSASDELS